MCNIHGLMRIRYLQLPTPTTTHKPDNFQFQMRRSFGPHMGGGSGGAGGGGGGGMIKTVHRAMRAGIGGGSGAGATTRTTGNRHQQQPINTTLSLSSNTNTPSSPCSYLNHPVPEAPPHKWTLTAAPATAEDFDWEHIDGDGGSSDGDSVNGFYDEFVFGNVPSEEEVHRAVSSLHEVLEPVSFGQLMKNRVTTYGSDDDDDGVEKVSSSLSVRKSGFEIDWTEPSMQLCYSSSALQVPSSDRVLDAFHMLQTEPLVQRMVISLSSDKAVWDAVMNNDVVRELRESVTEDKSICDESEGSDDDPNPVTQVLRWIFVNTKDRVIEIVEKITKVVNELVRPMNKDEKPQTDANVGINSFDEKLRSSFFLSIVVLLIVVVSRSSKG